MALQLDTSHIDTSNLIDPPDDLDQIKQDAKFWGVIYQTSDNPIKELDFVNDAIKYRDSENAGKIKTIIASTIDAFSGDFDTDPNNLNRVLLYFALHESEGGRYEKQVKGPAIGYWEIEPRTAYSIVRNSSYEWGAKAAAKTGYNHQQLAGMSLFEMQQFLSNENNNCAMACAVTLVNARAHHLIDYLKA